MMADTIKTFIRDGWNGDPTRIPCTIKHGENAIFIRPEGCGDAGSANGHGWPLMIEYYDKDIRVIVWADINKEDPTHVISLAGAQESNRPAETD
jgi:hypothetical protein